MLEIHQNQPPKHIVYLLEAPSAPSKVVLGMKLSSTRGIGH